MEKRIPVIIPAYEPDEKMIRLLQTLQESGIERIVVVDDGSGNEYRNLFEQAKQLGAIVLTHAVNLGKGRTTSRQNRNGATKSHVRCSNIFAAWRYRIPRPGCAAFRLRLCAI